MKIAIAFTLEVDVGPGEEVADAIAEIRNRIAAAVDDPPLESESRPGAEMWHTDSPDSLRIDSVRTMNFAWGQPPPWVIRLLENRGLLEV